MLAIKWQGWAQTMNDDDDIISSKGKKDNDLYSLLDEDYPTLPIHITFQDVVMVVALLIVCYVFGKIWKGCTYLILILAAVYYYMTHY